MDWVELIYSLRKLDMLIKSQLNNNQKVLVDYQYSNVIKPQEGTDEDDDPKQEISLLSLVWRK